MNERVHGDQEQILRNFRAVARSYVELFRTQRDHVHRLLGGAHALSSGIFREGLIRSFLSSVLPKAVSVSSGFVYGFEQVPSSKQIDILVWDSARHAAVFETQEFVIVPPESVIAAISVKTTLGRNEIQGALENLLSLVPIELTFRSMLDPESSQSVLRPILKMVVGYEGPRTADAALKTVGSFFEERFATNPQLAEQMIQALRSFDPIRPSRAHVDQVERVLPKFVAAIETKEVSLIQGWGPPEDQTGRGVYGPGLRRLPYMYAQGSMLTSPLEKVVYQVLQATYATIGTSGWSLVAAWGEFNPVSGVRFGDAEEILETQNARLIDPVRLASAIPLPQ